MAVRRTPWQRRALEPGLVALFLSASLSAHAEGLRTVRAAYTDERYTALGTDGARAWFIGTAAGEVWSTQDGGRRWTRAEISGAPVGWLQGPRRSASGWGVTAPLEQALSLTRNFGEQGGPVKLQYQERIYLYFTVEDAFRLPSVASGSWSDYLELGSDSPLFWGYPTYVFNFPRPGRWNLPPAMEPPGLESSRARLPTSDAPGRAVRALAVHPERPARVFAARADGLWRSDDGGASWGLALDTAWRGECCEQVAVAPDAPDDVYTVGLRGAFVSRDGGRSFDAPLGWPEPLTWVRPLTGRRLLVGTPEGVWVSQDGGARWARAAVARKWGGAPPVGAVASRAVDGRLLVVTPDALVRVDEDGAATALEVAPPEGESFLGLERLEESSWLAASSHHVLWGRGPASLGRVHSSAEPLVAVAAFDDGAGLVLSEGTLWRFSSEESRDPPPRRAALDALHRREPSLEASLHATLARSWALRPALQRLRDAKARAGWLPTVSAMAGLYWGDFLGRAAVTAYDDARTLGDDLRDPLQRRLQDRSLAVERDGRRVVPYAVVLLRWNLPELGFGRPQTVSPKALQRAQQQLTRAADQVRGTYLARRQALDDLYLIESSDPWVRAEARLRVEELTAQLNAATDGLWSAPLKWIQTQERR